MSRRIRNAAAREFVSISATLGCAIEGGAGKPPHSKWDGGAVLSECGSLLSLCFIVLEWLYLS